MFEIGANTKKIEILIELIKEGKDILDGSGLKILSASDLNVAA